MPKIANVVIQLERESKTPLAEQIADGIRQRIRANVVPPHAKLPPARTLAKRLGVNPATVVAAYRKLAAEGWVESRVGSGTYICPQLDIPAAGLVPAGERLGTGPRAASSSHFNLRSTGARPVEAGGGSATEIFPTGVLKRIIDHILDREGARAFGYTEVAGHPPLLDALRGYLREGGIAQGDDEIIIFSGAQQGLSVIVQALLHPGDWVAVERPTYPGILRLLQRAGACVEAVDLLPDGAPDLRALERLFRTRPIRLFYGMPVYQNPTGACYPPEARRSLLELCAKHGVTLVEDDSQSDLNFGNGIFHPLRAYQAPSTKYEAPSTKHQAPSTKYEAPSTKHQAPSTKHEVAEIIYLKSFSRLLMPGFRLGFCLAPPRVAAMLRRVKEESDLSTSGFFQRVLHLFLHHGYFREHLTQLQAMESARFAEAVKHVENELLPAGFRWLRPQGGARIWLQLPAGTDAAAFFAESARRGLLLKPGAEFAPDGATADWFAVETAALTGRPGAEFARTLVGKR